MRIDWIGNHQARYREAMWAEIARRCPEFNVHMLFPFNALHNWTYRSDCRYTSTLIDQRQLIGFQTKRSRAGFDPYVFGKRAAIQPIIQQADVVILCGWDQPFYLQILHAARRRNVGVVLFYESFNHRYTSGVVARVRQKAFEYADVILTPGIAATEAVLRSGVAATKVIESVNAIDVDGFYAEAEAARLGANALAPHRFVVVGQLVERKFVDGVIRALSHGESTWTLDVAGDGPMLSTLRDLATELGVADRVSWHGNVTAVDMPRFLGTRHTVLLPSKEEVWGMTANEGLACGLQVVVSVEAGVARFIGELEGVWLIRPNEVELLDAMRKAARNWVGWFDGRVQSASLSPAVAADRTLAAVDLAIIKASGM